MSWLLGIGRWLLKLLLGGLYGQELQQAQDEAQNAHDAAVEHAHSTQEAAKTEVEMLKAQEEARKKIEAQKGTPDDPFANNEWNEGT